MAGTVGDGSTLSGQEFPETPRTHMAFVHAEAGESALDGRTGHLLCRPAVLAVTGPTGSLGVHAHEARPRSSRALLMGILRRPRARGPAGHDGPMSDAPTTDLRVTPALTVPAAELSWRFSRSSGPGGQGVNTADSRVELSWDIASSHVLAESQRARLLARLDARLVRGVLTVVASEHRAQLRNREAARARLATLVAEALAPPPRTRRPTRPTRGSRERRLDAKKRRADVKRMRRRPED